MSEDYTYHSDGIGEVYGACLVTHVDVSLGHVEPDFCCVAIDPHITVVTGILAGLIPRDWFASFYSD